MTNPTWPIGPARCRSDEYSAHIVGFFDGFIVGVLSHKRPATTTQEPFWWDEEGNAIGEIPTELAGLLPPKLTREEAIAECWSRAGSAVYNEPFAIGTVQMEWCNAFLLALEKLKAEGRIDD